MRLKRRRRILTTLTVVGASGGVGLFFILYSCMGLGQLSRVVEYPGAVQVIANAKRAWVFCNIEKSVKEPGAIAGAPRTRTIAQVAVCFDENGVVQRIPITVGPRSTFNHNLVEVFGLDDGLYMLGPSPSELSKWRGDRFEPLADVTRESFAKLPELATTPHYREAPLLERASRTHGWTPLVKENDWIGDALPFTWNGGSFVLQVDRTTSPAGVHLRRKEARREWSSPIGNFAPKARPAVGDE